MSGFNTSAIDAAVVCLRVMRRLLQDEEVTLSQLNYLIENIHEPLAQSCLPPSQRPVVPSLSPSSSVAGNRSSSITRQSGSSLIARAISQSCEGDKKKITRQPPQPAVVAPPGGMKPPSIGQLSGTTKHAPSGGATRKAAATKVAAPRLPLTFSQYWDLFANLPTLYAVHMALVQHLEGIIQRLLHMVEELQSLREVADVTPLADDGATHHGSSHPIGPASPDAQAGTTCTASTQHNWSSRKHVSALRFPASGAMPTNRGVYGEIGVMVNDFFGSELMKHYIAEHIMYTVKFTQRTAPQLLRLSRVWRWTGGAAPGDTHGVPLSALSNLAEADRAMLLQYSLFLDFLWRSFGRDGTPQDSRVTLPPSLESHSASESGSTPTVTANAASAADATGTTGGGNSGQRRARATAAGTAGATGGASSASASSPSGAGKSTLPPIPAMWEGFRTILALLATPLAGLRRYSHVARCLIESGALQQKDRDRLQESFIDIVVMRMSEETNLVMEELWTHDVAGIMALMDMPGSRAAADKAGIQAGPRRVGTGGVGAAGVGGGGVHNGHTIAQDSVAGAGGAAGVAAGVGAAVSGAVTPASAAVGLQSTPSADCSNRALIHYGRLSKRFGRGRHERLTFLFSDWMCYVEECSNGRFRVRGTIPLPGLRVVEVRDEESSDATYGFELLSQHLPKRLIFFTASPEQRGQWVDAIRYTVRRFCDQHQLRQEVASSSTTVTNSSVVAPAVTMGETGLPSVMRSTAPMLTAQSRLCRQRRYDAVWQDYVDAQRRTAEATARTSPVLPAMSMASLGGGVPGSVSSNAQSPPPQAILSGDQSRNSSFGGQRSGSMHRQLEYDVTPWSQQASVHRRIRSQELLAAHQQQPRQGTASTSHTASPTHSAGTRLNASLSLGPEEIEKTMAMAGGSMGDAFTLEAAASLPCLADDGRSTAQLPTPLLLSPNGGSPGKFFERRRSSSLRPAFLETLGSASTRIGGSGGIGTPLRRPISERFEAVKNGGSGGGNKGAGSPSRPQLRRASTSLLNEANSSTTAGKGMVVSDAALSLAATTVGVTGGAASGSGKTAEMAETHNADAASPLPQGSLGGSEEELQLQQVVLEDSTTELSEPVEGEEEEEHPESDSALDVRHVEEDEGDDKHSQHPHRALGGEGLYSEILDDSTARGAEVEAESSHASASSQESSHCPSADGLDNVIAASPGAALSEVSEDDNDGSRQPARASHKKASVASQEDKNASRSSPTLLSPLLQENERATDTHHAPHAHVVHEGVSLSAGGAECPTATSPHDKLADEDDATTEVVTAFRRNSSPVRSVMSPISPTEYAPGSLLLAVSPQQDAASQNCVSASERPLPASKGEDPSKKSRHVDPTAEGGIGRSKK